MIRFPRPFPRPRPLVPSLAAMLAVAAPAAAETVTLSGTVAERFGPKFVLETPDGRVLVDGGPDWRAEGAPQPGDAVTVTGRQGEAGIAATAMVVGDAREIVIAAPETADLDALAPAAMAALTERLRAAGIAAPRLVATTSRHVRFETEGPTGAGLAIETDREGRIRRAEGRDAAALAPDWALRAAAAEGIATVEALRFTARHVHLAGTDAAGARQRVRLSLREEGAAETPPPPAAAARPPVEELRRRVEAAGYVWEGRLALRRAHAEVDARNPEGEPVRLRLDRDGEITRERARR